MSLIYRAPNLVADQPQTHALVIGVGQYTHLDNVPQLRLGQLTSPLASAKAFARWLIDAPLKNPNAPLGTVDVLLAASTLQAQQMTLADGSVGPVEDATYENIERAFDAWCERCNRPNQVAIFYFCGHGLEKEHLALLPADFGRSRSNPWNSAINFNKTRTGMQTTCKASVQCFFIDTCRQVDSQTLETSDFGGNSLRQNDLTGLHDTPTTLTLFAAEVGQSAYGEQNAPSRFTTMLLKALAGGGAFNRGGNQWVINLQSLTNGIVGLMQLANQEARNLQMTYPLLEGPNFTRVIHHVDQCPSVLVKISCQPATALAAADLQLISSRQCYQRPPAAAPWQIQVEAGTYDIRAGFAHGEFAPIEFTEAQIFPPYFEQELEVGP